MPKLSDTMEEGKILHWLKHPGDEIHHGDAIAEVETDKADMVMEAFDDGVLQEIHLHEGDSAPVGAVIGVMSKPGEKYEPSGKEGGRAKLGKKEGGAAAARDAERERAAKSTETEHEQLSQPEMAAEEEGATAEKEAAGEEETAIDQQEEAAEEEPAEEGAKREPQFHPALAAHPSAAPTAIPMPPARRPNPIEPAVHVVSAQDGEDHKLRASPLARRAAEEAGIDLSHVRGSGPDGRITKRDVDHYLREQELFRMRRLVTPNEGIFGTHQELSKMRRTIAKRMALSKREIPHFYVTVEVDMDEAVKLKSSLEATELFEEDITYNDIVVKACALALARYPRINASYEREGITIHPSINIGVAVAVEDGLIVPVIKECQRLSLAEIARLAHRLVGKAARGGFTSDELSGSTFTISNMGMLGVEHFAAVITPPQAAILAVSAIREKPVVRNGQIVVGNTMMLTVSCDHRIVDGVVAGRFLQELRRFLENPASLLVS
jgi:pyruvate dehydrogenase E2 component (dihydrolipoamide acetyltransferase)